MQLELQAAPPCGARQSYRVLYMRRTDLKNGKQLVRSEKGNVVVPGASSQVRHYTVALALLRVRGAPQLARARYHLQFLWTLDTKQRLIRDDLASPVWLCMVCVSLLSPVDEHVLREHELLVAVDARWNHRHGL